jgi:hypothetical protein
MEGARANGPKRPWLTLNVRQKNMTIINVAGLILNIVGTIIVSVCGGGLLTTIHTALIAHQVTLHAYLTGERNIPLFTGLDESRERQMKKSQRWLVSGLILIAIGFALQVYVLVPDLIKELKK